MRQRGGCGRGEGVWGGGCRIGEGAGEGRVRERRGSWERGGCGREGGGEERVCASSHKEAFAINICSYKIKHFVLFVAFCFS